MSTRESYYFSEEREGDPPHVESGVHVYRELHDGCVHLQLYRGNSEINVILPLELWAVLEARLVKAAP